MYFYASRVITVTKPLTSIVNWIEAKLPEVLYNNRRHGMLTTGLMGDGGGGLTVKRESLFV
jgi:hypothetical protein